MVRVWFAFTCCYLPRARMRIARVVRRVILIVLHLPCLPPYFSRFLLLFPYPYPHHCPSVTTYQTGGSFVLCVLPGAYENMPALAYDNPTPFPLTLYAFAIPQPDLAPVCLYLGAARILPTRMWTVLYNGTIRAREPSRTAWRRRRHCGRWNVDMAFC